MAQADYKRIAQDCYTFLHTELRDVKLPNEVLTKRNQLLDDIREVAKNGNLNLDEELDEVGEYMDMPEIDPTNIKRISAVDAGGDCLKKGMMSTKKTKYIGLKSKQYWCVLQSDGNFLMYNKENDPLPVITLLINEYVVTASVQKKGSRTLVFTPQFPGRKMYELTAADPDAWVHVIDRKLKNKPAGTATSNQRAGIPRPRESPQADGSDIYYEEGEEEKNLYDDAVTEPADDPINEYDDIADVSGHTGGIRPPVDEDDLQEDIYDTVTEVEQGETSPENKNHQESTCADTGIPDKPARHEFLDLYYAIHTATSTKFDELKFNFGDVIRVTSRQFDADSWWVGELHGQRGLVPKSFLRPVYVPVK